MSGSPARTDLTSGERSVTIREIAVWINGLATMLMRLRKAEM